MQILSRVPDADFFDRESEMARLLSFARRGHDAVTGNLGSAPGSKEKRTPGRLRQAAKALLLGAPRHGKSEILRKTFDRLFLRQTAFAPIYLALRSYNFEPQRFAADYLSQFLSQFNAFRRQDPRLISLADESLVTITQNALPEDYPWVRTITESFSQAQKASDIRHLFRCALSAPSIAASHTQCAPYLMIDNYHLLGDASAERLFHSGALAALRAEFIRVISGQENVVISPEKDVAPVYVLCGLRRLITEMMPPEEGIFENLELIRVESLSEGFLDQMLRAMAARLGLDLSDSTAELMIHQLGGDLFYLRALLDAATMSGASLRSFMEFERLYTGEVLRGRINHYLTALLREVAPDARVRRAAMEVLNLTVESSSPVPLEAVSERIAAHTAEGDNLLARLHARELIEITYGFVSSSADTVLADYVRSTYRTEVTGARRPIAGEELLGEKLKHSYRLMMTRYDRAVEQRLVDLLWRFEFQFVPARLLDATEFENQYRGMSRAEIRQALESDEERFQLPQVVLIKDLGICEIDQASCRLYSAGGFVGGIYNDANETMWMIALINAKEQVDQEIIQQIELRLRTAHRPKTFGTSAHSVHWIISKEGFTAAAQERLKTTGAYHSTLVQFDLLADYLAKAAGRDEESRSASEVELVIPIEDEAELIAVRTVEQIARAADFDKESINQIKTALVEACINAAEHSNSPDRKIYHRFAIVDDRLVISVSNKGKAFDGVITPPAANGSTSSKGTRGRGLKIIRGLMDEVRFDRTDEGTTLVMTKLLKHQVKQ